MKNSRLREPKEELKSQSKTLRAVNLSPLFFKSEGRVKNYVTTAFIVKRKNERSGGVFLKNAVGVFFILAAVAGGEGKNRP